jgi:YD repeat-containing protein
VIRAGAPESGEAMLQRRPCGSVMKRRGGALLLLIPTLFSACLILSAPSAFADVVYLYDDLGRLVRVIREDGAVATYQYDAVGNILGITRESSVLQTTTVTSSAPSSGPRGARVTLTILGVNLAGASVSSPNAGILFENLRSTPDQLLVDLVIASTAALGPTTLQVVGPLGSVSISFTVT